MATATDVITYVGVPLAVLGVLPILYTFGVAILNQRRIRRALQRHGHKPILSSKQLDGFTIRSSPMTTLIEVELPKYAIAPLERHDDQYWRLSHDRVEGDREIDHLLERADSTLSTIEEGRVRGFLRGGSWRAFHWKKLIVGKKLYRIQYEDELREPPAEVDFTDLIHFLLDWGAELDPMGWEKLRSGGLWTPAGTVLLNMPRSVVDHPKGRKEWVLRTSMPDEGDGILTLCIKWPAEYCDVESSRGAKSLPPGWGRLQQPYVTMIDEIETKDEGVAPVKPEASLARRVEALKINHEPARNSTSVRFKTESGSISKVYWERSNVETNTFTNLDHLDSSTVPPQGQTWFSTAAYSLLLSHRSNYTPSTSSSSSGPNANVTATTGTLWGFQFSHDLSDFSRRDTVPVGIMVLLNILPDDQAPAWTTTASRSTHIDVNAAKQHRDRFEAQRAAERLEATMPPEQARVARMNRQMAERRQAGEDLMALNVIRRQNQEKRFADALTSSKMDNKAIANLCLKWLINKEEVSSEDTIYSVVEAVLYLLILDDTVSQGEEENNQVEIEAETQIEGQDHGHKQPGHPRSSLQDLQQKSEAFCILKAIDEWTRWANAGGMMKEHFHWLEEHTRDFCLAACVVAVVREGALANLGHGHGGHGAGAAAGGAGHAGQGKASLDMIECLDMWRKVRLG